MDQKVVVQMIRTCLALQIEVVDAFGGEHCPIPEVFVVVIANPEGTVTVIELFVVGRDPSEVAAMACMASLVTLAAFCNIE